MTRRGESSSSSGRTEGPCLRVPISASWTLHADDIDQRLVAACPVSCRSEPVETCATCPQAVGFERRPDAEGCVVVCRAPAPAARADNAVPRIAEIMTRDVFCVSPDLDVATLASLFVERGFSGCPVVDAEARPIGVVSQTDLVRLQDERGRLSDVESTEVDDGFDPHHPPSSRAPITVGRLMTPLAFALRETTSVIEAAELMALEEVHRVPVVSAAGRVVGMLSSLDIVRWVAAAHRRG